MTKYNLIDFLNDIAFSLDRASNFSFKEGEAKEHACEIYQDFIANEAKFIDADHGLLIKLPKFGDDDYDWSHTGAHVLAHEYSISYWDE